MILGISFLSLYIIGAFSTWRIAKYLCLRFTCISFIPVVAIFYFTYVVDRVNVESLDTKWSIHGYIQLAGLLLGIVGWPLQYYLKYDSTVIVGRIMLISGIVIILSNTLIAYYTVIENSLPYFWLMFILAVFTGFTPLLLVASFKLPHYIEEGLEMSYGNNSDVDVG